MEQKILLIDEVAHMLRVAPVTIRRWLHLARSGKGNFPLPISPPGCKLRWLATDIEAILQSNTALPNATDWQQNRKSFKERQTAASKALERHRKKR